MIVYLFSFLYFGFATGTSFIENLCVIITTGNLSPGFIDVSINGSGMTVKSGTPFSWTLPIWITRVLRSGKTPGIG